MLAPETAACSAVGRSSRARQAVLLCGDLSGFVYAPTYPMLVRVGGRTTATRWRWFALLSVLTTMLGTAQIEIEEAAIEQTAATSGATISVLDAVKVMGSITWWGVDMAMETAGYGKTKSCSRAGVCRFESSVGPFSRCYRCADTHTRCSAERCLWLPKSSQLLESLGVSFLGSRPMLSYFAGAGRTSELQSSVHENIDCPATQSTDPPPTEHIAENARNPKLAFRRASRDTAAIAGQVSSP